nr:hypothetical protein [Nannocystis pusilla]
MISEVETIWMLMFSRARISNALEATPAWVRMPTPTIEILQMSGSLRISIGPASGSSRLRRPATAFLRSFSGTVKVTSVEPPRLAFWMIMSTTMSAPARTPKIDAMVPGTSGTLVRVTLASLRSRATPVTTADSRLFCSDTIHVPSLSFRLDRTCTGTPNFMANSTLRICSTLAPRLASSSISSYVMRWILRARLDPRVGGVDPVDVGQDLADVGLQRRRQRDRRGVGAAAAERGDVAGGV